MKQLRNQLKNYQKPTHNYIVFDDQTINILKYGFPFVMAAAAGA